MSVSTWGISFQHLVGYVVGEVDGAWITMSKAHTSGVVVCKALVIYSLVGGQFSLVHRYLYNFLEFGL
jgi:hypothetical protein